MSNNFYSSSKPAESQLESKTGVRLHRGGWQTIGRGVCLALTLVMVAPVAADINVVYQGDYRTNAIGKLKNWWSSLWDNSHQTQGMMSKSLSPIFVVPFLQEAEVKLIAGKSALNFWLTVGDPPYTIFVEKEGKVIGRKVSDDIEILLKLDEPLKVGHSYDLTVSHSAPGNLPVKRTLKIVANYELPRPTNEQRREIQNSQEQHISCVQWLAKQQQGVWAFEAYQFLMGGGDDKQILSACGIN